MLIDYIDSYEPEDFINTSRTTSSVLKLYLSTQQVQFLEMSEQIQYKQINLNGQISFPAHLIPRASLKILSTFLDLYMPKKRQGQNLDEIETEVFNSLKDIPGDNL